MGKEYHKNVPASYLVLIKDNKILLLRRFNTGFEDGKYSLVAGHLNEGETFTDAIIREAGEEANITLQPEHLEAAHIMHRKSQDSERVDTFFITKQFEGEIKNLEPHKCDHLDWFNIDDLPKNMIPYIKEAVECVRNNIFYSEYGWE